MRQHFERYAIWYMIAVVLIVGVVIFVEVYRPAVGSGVSGNNDDWGNFGAFFWGFGAMCFTLVNAIVFHTLSRVIHRKQFYDTYRQALDGVINAYLDLPNANKPNNDKIPISPNKQLKASMIQMTGILGGIKESNMFSNKVETYAIKLLEDGDALIENATYEDLRNHISNLSGFQVCLLNNNVSSTRKKEIIRTRMRANK